MNRSTGRLSARKRDSIWRRLRPAPVAFLAAALVTGGAWARGKATPAVAVLQLHVSVGGVSPDAGIAAARLLSEALASTEKYEVGSSDDIEAALREREFSPPFGVGHVQLMADVLDVDVVVHGSIRALTFDPDAGSASVTVAVEIVDGKRGTLKGTHEATGAYTAPEGESKEQQAVIMGALAAAAEALAEKISGVEARVGETEVAAGDEPAGTPDAPAIAPDVEADGDGPKSGVPMADLVVEIEEPPADPEPKPDEPATEEPADEPIAIVIKPDEDEQPPPDPKPSPDPAPEPEYDPYEDELPPINVKVLARMGDKDVLTTLGRNGSIAKKMELEVYRVKVGRDGATTRRRIGRIRVSKLNRTDAEARVLEGGALISTGDIAYFEGP